MKLVNSFPHDGERISLSDVKNFSSWEKAIKELLYNNLIEEKILLFIMHVDESVRADSGEIIAYIFYEKPIMKSGPTGTFFYGSTFDLETGELIGIDDIF